MTDTKRPIVDVVPEVIAYIFYCIIIVVLTYNQIFGHIFSDFLSHIERIDPIVKGEYYMPHALFHYLVYGFRIFNIDHYAAALILTVLVNLATLFFLHKILNAVLPERLRNLPSLLLAICLSLVTAIWIPWFNKSVYLGQWSPNIWHSPTFYLVKPFMLGSFYYFVLLIKEKTKFTLKNGILFAMILAVSVIAKPSFLFSFTPAIIVYLLIFNWKNYPIYFKVGLSLLPALGLIFYQFLQTYLLKSANTGSDMKDEIIFTFFGVLKLYSPNIFISFLLAMAFPITVLFLDIKSAVKDKFLMLAFLNTFFAYIQAAFLAEKYKLWEAAFTFGYSLSLFLLFIFSLSFFMNWLNHQQWKSWIVQLKVIFSTAIFAMHLISGIIYLMYNIYERTF
jgi:hypothetical protein